MEEEDSREQQWGGCKVLLKASTGVEACRVCCIHALGVNI